MDTLQNMGTIYLVWLFVMRFKRVEVQVAEDHKETTVGIFTKLRFIAKFDFCFLLAHILFILPLLIYGENYESVQKYEINFQT